MSDLNLIRRIACCYNGVEYYDEDYRLVSPPEDIMMLYDSIDDYHILYEQASLLHLAAENADMKALKYLAEHELDVNALNVRGQSPLHIIASLAQEKWPVDIIRTCADILLEEGADPGLEDSEGNNCAAVAVRYGTYGVLEELIAHHQKLEDSLMVLAVEYTRYEGSHYFRYSLPKYRRMMIESARQANNGYQKQDGNLDTLVSECEERRKTVQKYFKTIQTLIGAGVDPLVKGADGKNALEMAEYCDDWRIREVLKGTYDPAEDDIDD